MQVLAFAALATSLPLLVVAAAGAPPDDLEAITRFIHDVPYTTEVATPHVRWAKPYARGPIRVFAIPTVRGGRDVVELAQRLDLALTTVTVDPDWRLNALGLGDQTAARGARERFPDVATYRITDDYLRLLAGRPGLYDCYLIPTLRGWDALPAEVRQTIARQVANGAGLVLVHPRCGAGAADEFNRLSPLRLGSSLSPSGRGVPRSSLSPPGRGEGEGQDAEERLCHAEAWRTPPGAAPHFIVRGVPMEFLRVDAFRHTLYDTAGEVVLETVQGAPILAVREVGRGRVVALAYDSDCLAPRVHRTPSPTEGEGIQADDDRGFEAIYSLLCRAIVWAARRESNVELRGLALDPPTIRPATNRDAFLAVTIASAAGAATRPAAPGPVSLRLTVRNEEGRELLTRNAIVGLAAGDRRTVRVPLGTALDGGRNVAEVILTDGLRTLDWGMLPVPVEREAVIDAVELPKTFYWQGATVAGRATVRTAGLREVELSATITDRWGRELARDSVAQRIDLRGDMAFALRPRPSRSAGATLRCAVRVGARTSHAVGREVFFAMPRPAGKTAVVVAEPAADEPPTRWRPAIDRQLRLAGATALLAPRSARTAGSILRAEADLSRVGPTTPGFSPDALLAAARPWVPLSPVDYRFATYIVPPGPTSALDLAALAERLRAARRELWTVDPEARTALLSEAAHLYRAVDCPILWTGFDLPLLPLGGRRLQDEPQTSRVDLGRRYSLINPDFTLSESGKRQAAIIEALHDRGLATLILGSRRDAAAPWRYADGDALYFTSPAPSGAVTLDVPRHAYDCVTGLYLGRVREVKPADHWVTALLPYRVTGLRLEAAARRDEIALTVRVETEAGGLVGRHVVAVDVVDPSGASRPEYHLTLDASGGVLRGTVPLALSDPPGAWTLRARDAATGVSAEARIEVRPATQSN